MKGEYLELLLGCGHRRDKLLGPPGAELKWQNLITLDINEKCRPDILCDLNVTPWYPTDWWQRSNQPVNIDALFGPGPKFCFQENLFDEVHAYEVMEHLGAQGDHHAFFAHFAEIWSMLKPGGYFFGTVPSRYSGWLWGDPSHRRAILPETLIFLSQPEYDKQCDGPVRTPMTDFRYLYKADFDVVQCVDNHVSTYFALRAVKPSRISKTTEGDQT